MADEPNINPSDPQDQNPQNEGGSGDAPKQESTKTFTEAEVSAMVADRLAKNEKALRKQLQKEMEQEREKAEMSEAERYKAEVEERDQRIQELEAKHREASQRAQLAGKVSDVDYALFKVQQAVDQYVSDDGQVDVDAFLKDYDQLRAQPTPKPGPAPTTAGGGPTEAADMNTFIRQKAGRQ